MTTIQIKINIEQISRNWFQAQYILCDSFGLVSTFHLLLLETLFKFTSNSVQICRSNHFWYFKKHYEFTIRAVKQNKENTLVQSQSYLCDGHLNPFASSG